jgi:IS1 family transposase
MLVKKLLLDMLALRAKHKWIAVDRFGKKYLDFVCGDRSTLVLAQSASKNRKKTIGKTETDKSRYLLF